jgi:hypothetical protein
MFAYKELTALHSPCSCQGQLQTPQLVSVLEFCAHLNNLEMTEHIGKEGDIKYDLCLRVMK